MNLRIKEPLHIVEIGNVLAAVWDNDPSLPSPERFSVVVARKKKEIPYFEKADVPDLIRATELAREWIKTHTV